MAQSNSTYWGGERNSCFITTPTGERQVLTVPVYGSRRVQPIEEIRICYMHAWQRQHWAALYSAYGKTPYWQYYADYIRPIYESQPEFLWQLNAKTDYILRCLLQNQRPEMSFLTSGCNLPFPNRGEGALQGGREASILDLLFEYGPETVLKI